MEKRQRINKNEKPVIRREGDVFTVEFIQNKEPKRKPICRVNGMIGFINKTHRAFVEPRSVWLVELTTITDKFVIVNPIECIETAAEHAFQMERKMKELKTFVDNQQKAKRNDNKVKH